MHPVARHKAALRRLKHERKGVAVDFLEDLTSYDEDTDETEDEGVLIVSGYAVELDDTKSTYEAIGLTEEEALTLFFVPNSIGGLPKLSNRVKWADEIRTVKDVIPIRPAGLVIAAQVIIT